MRALTLLAILSWSFATLPLEAQDVHIHYPIDTIERLLRYGDFQLLDIRGSRMDGDRTQQVGLAFHPDTTLLVKWALAPRNGEAFNNVPRYELAAYEIQKLFLDEAEYVVPPTVVRSFPLEWYRAEYQSTAWATFGGDQSTFVTLQFWLGAPIAPHEALDRERFRTDELYARHFANLNVLTYLIRHNDSNSGNVLISETERPRLFAVDNGVAFASQPSDRGSYWRDLRIDRIPAGTAERLRGITLQDLELQLGVLAQLEARDGRHVPVESGENLRPNAGTRRADGIVQFGLTAREIRDVHNRLIRLVRQIDSGRIATF
jgi:hypothetical protein